MLFRSDPRGIGASTPRLDCFTTPTERDIWNTQAGYRILDASDDGLLNLYIARAQVVGGRCAAASALLGDIGQYMSTASVATDMLNIVEKLGQDKLQYWGFVSRLSSQAINSTDSRLWSELRHRPWAVLRRDVP